jgi:hypothetical protein
MGLDLSPCPQFIDTLSQKPEPLGKGLGVPPLRTSSVGHGKQVGCLKKAKGPHFWGSTFKDRLQALLLLLGALRAVRAAPITWLPHTKFQRGAGVRGWWEVRGSVNAGSGQMPCAKRYP